MATPDDLKYIYRDWRQIYNNQQSKLAEMYISGHLTPSQIQDVAGQIRPTVLATEKFVKAKKLNKLEDYRMSLFSQE
jgi:hypothetical protein